MLTNNQAISLYKKLVEYSDQSQGTTEKVLGYAKRQLESMLQKRIDSEYHHFYLLSRNQRQKLSDAQYELDEFDVVEFLDKTPRRKIAWYREVIHSIDRIKDKELQQDIQHIQTTGKKLIAEAQQNISHEGRIVAFVESVGQTIKQLRDKQHEFAEALEKLTAVQLQVSTDIQEIFERDEEITKLFFREGNKREPSLETMSIFSEHYQPFQEAKNQAERSVDIFLESIHTGNYDRGLKVLKLRKDEMSTNYLRNLVGQIASSLYFLADAQEIEKTSPYLKKIKQTLIKNTEDLKINIDKHVYNARHTITKQYLHKEVIGQFDDLFKMVEEAITLESLTHHVGEQGESYTIPDLRKGLTLLSSKTLAFLDQQENNINTSILQEEVERQINTIEILSKELFERDRILREELLKEQEIMARRNAIKNKLIQSVMILLSVLALPFTFFREVLGFVTDIISQFLKEAPKKAREGFGKALDKTGLGDNDMLNSMRDAESLKDMLNAMFNKSLRAMSDNLPYQKDLRSRNTERLRGVELLNYDQLDSGVLVGEIFYIFTGDGREKETVDHYNKHILETNLNDSETTDHSFFLDTHQRSFHQPEDDQKIPGILIKAQNCKVGRNSIVCPRGYIPIITEGTKQYFKELDINYELYCIKDKGYYYLQLSHKPIQDIQLHYYRYGDTNYNGIFFNTGDHQAKTDETIDPQEALLESIITLEQLPSQLQEEYQQCQEDKEDLIERIDAVTNMFRYNLKYSTQKKHTTKQYDTYENYLEGVAHTGVGDCKNVNSLNIGMMREMKLPAQMCAGYVLDTQSGQYEGHGITEIAIDGKSYLCDATPGNEVYDDSESKAEKITEKIKEGLLAGMNGIKDSWDFLMTPLNALAKIDTSSWFLRRKVLLRQKELAAYIHSNYNMDPLMKKMYTLPVHIEKLKLVVDDYQGFLKELVNRSEQYLGGKYRSEYVNSDVQVVESPSLKKAIYQQYKIFQQISLFKDTLNEFLGLSLGIEDLFVTHKQIQELDPQNNAYNSRQFIEQLLTSLGSSLDPQEFINHCKDNDCQLIINKGVELLQATRPEDLFLPLDLLEGSVEDISYEKDKELHEKLKYQKKGVQYTNNLYWKIAKKTQELKYKVDGFNADLFLLVCEKKLDELIAMPTSQWSEDLADEIEKAHDNFSKGWNISVSNSEGTGVRIIIEILKKLEEGDIDKRYYHNRITTGDEEHRDFYRNIYHLLQPMKVKGYSQTPAVYERAKNYLNYLSDQQFLADSVNVLCLLEDLKKWRMDIGTSTSNTMHEASTGHALSKEDIMVIEDKCKDLLMKKYSYNTTIMAHLMKHYKIDDKMYDSILASLDRGLDNGSYQIIISHLIQSGTSRRSRGYLGFNAQRSQEYELLEDMLVKANNKQYLAGLKEILTYLKREITESNTGKKAGILFSERNKSHQIIDTVIASESTRKKEGQFIDAKALLYLQRIKRHGVHGISLAPETDDWKGGQKI